MHQGSSLLLALGLSAAILSGCSASEKQSIETERLQPRQVSALGRIEPLDGILKVSLPNSLSNDSIRQVLVEEGQVVEQGQALAILETQPVLKANLNKAEAEVTAAQRGLDAQISVIERYRAERRQAQAEARRGKELYQDGATSLQRYEALQADSDAALAQLNEAIANEVTLKAEVGVKQAQVKQARADLDQSTVKAPSKGTILEILARPGNRVGEDGLLLLGDTTKMGVVAEVYQSDLPEIRPGQTATITANGFPDRSQKAKVTEIAQQISSQSVATGEAGDKVDQRVVKVKLALPKESLAIASRINNLQVNVLFDPLTDEQRRIRPQQP
ncbi:ABC exporter membrane fusion/ DevB family [Synechococcus sp. BIOS-U3-1]|uniref:efflux RND transporter periplasmic adaptor subunit n=1 Tax=Synechococcus sp. BIOS-U3-1 TaxID=1400865 RepID=UPI0016478D45|nr:efflux RND transporter periplasmic adaptor subunit [Synechococcus sp. BIOS-U3-1]QNI58715.1 ABC exporter membrane fusion/ DevB family [Synechococcus sp. BIOS-U3-1]|tara:strand:- start:946 stop:1938 length:993 start_codon:yes stop_codon:yes gene_type:complete